MARLSWDAPGERLFETGVDHGVFYPQTGQGVAWTGLVSVNESSDGGEADPFYIDGIKFLEMPSSEDFALSLSALSAPTEFAQCDGYASTGSGLFIGQQPRKPFGLAYRTRVGNDIVGVDLKYKLHVVYNLLAAPATRDYTTQDDSSTVLTLNWGMTTTPESIAGYKPSAHLVIDSGDIDPVKLVALEDLLYGTDTTAPQLPTAQEIATLVG